jgi:hypothetical protein
LCVTFCVAINLSSCANTLQLDSMKCFCPPQRLLMLVSDGATAIFTNGNFINFCHLNFRLWKQKKFAAESKLKRCINTCTIPFPKVN